MREIDKILKTIEGHISENTYSHIETDKLELKDLSTGNDWKELYKTVCSFLNTNGGIIVIGIKEDNNTKCFKFTGYNPDNEPNIKKINTRFHDYYNRPIDLSEHIKPEYIEIIPFLDGQVCVVFIEKLPDEQKFVFFEKQAYERQLTGDHKIDEKKIKAQLELIETLLNVKELSIVQESTLDDLNVDKLNEFIIRLNKDIKVETLKPDIPSALPFLTRRKFIRDINPTLLGILVCGDQPYTFVGGRCEVDCYFDSGIEVALDKKVYKDNIISLMESCITYVYSKTGTGISIEKGGSTLFEYPERVIRETVNNALAHRDYSVDRFVNINIVPNKHIEIRNPGHFRQEQLVVIESDILTRRIIPLPRAQNPNLADVLKTYDRWEGKGWGMSTLTNYALNNTIDIPYFRMHSENDISLFVVKGKVFDEEMNIWLNSFSKYLRSKNNGNPLSDEEKTVLAYFYKSERLNRLERFTIILTPDNNHFEVIKNLEDKSLIKKIEYSPKLYPLYIVDRLLTKKDFYIELKDLLGNVFDSLNIEYKNILNAIYHFGEYSDIENMSANTIGNFLYLQDNKDLSNLQKYEQYKRKVRTQINRLEEKNLIVRKTAKKPDYRINMNYSSNTLL